tara:strand:- start:3242 stop:3928 length:687 start_codon:yes stop_codon:yes gene_type:complete
MTDRTEAQTLGIDAISSKQGVKKSIDPTLDSAARKSILDRQAMSDEVVSKSDLLDIFNTHCQIGNTSKVDGAITISITGTGTDDLYPPDNPQPTSGGDYEGYVKITGLNLISEKGGLSVASSEVTIGIAGDYYTSHAYLDASSAVNTNNIGFTIAVERSGNLNFQQRAIGSRGFNGDNRTNISGGGFLPALLVGDKLSVWVASSATTTVTVHDANLGINLRAPSNLVT